MKSRVGFISLLGLACLALASVPAMALDPYDTPEISCESSTLASITLHVCSPLGSTGAPAGLTIQWKTAADYAASGWADDGTLCRLSLSGQPSLQHPGKSRWELVPGECENVTIGDINFDETGVSGQGCGLEPLECATEYVFRWFAHAGRGFGRSDWGDDLTCSTLACPSERCTYTQGYWKNHGGPVGCNQAPVNPPDPVWPASVMTSGMSLGSPPVNYSAAQLCTILNTQGGQKGLITLAHQLIAAKLNLANNATGCAALDNAIALANSQIGNVNLYNLAIGTCTGPGVYPPGCGNTVPSANTDLTNFNEGVLGGLCGPHCSIGPLKQDSGEAAAPALENSTWGAIKSTYK